MAEPAYGPKLLDRLAAGEAPADALAAELGADAGDRLRQVAVVGADGEVAVYTGEGCIPFAGDIQGDGWSAQANLMASEEVWPAMGRAFEAAEGTLARRLLAVLEAGEAAGGDVRGRQSSALLVVPAEGEPWQRTVELRVEDDPQPLDELSRLLTLSEAYSLATEAEELGAAGRHEEASEAGRRALELAPDNAELLFWAGLALAHQGEVPAGVELVQRAIETNPGWRDLLGRLSQEIAPGAAKIREALTLDASS
jgi:uncharacterized Ntn-hydrolase superfamily protein